MKYLEIKDLKASQIVLGCMRIASLNVDQVEALVLKALDEGINFFDHADIYGGGKSEELFGEVLKRNPELRQKMIIQTKCGICKGFFDFSYEHIMESVKKSCERLQTDHVEILLLHRPDTLMDPKEVARAFNDLYESGMVRYFGVSNMNPMQIELIQKYTKHPMIFNQVQFNPVNAGMVDVGIHVNMKDAQAIDRDGSLLEYCRLHDMTLQPWSIMQASWEEGTYLDNPDYQALNDTLDELAKKYEVNKTSIVIAWIVRHPANMQPIAGTTNPQHLSELCLGADIELTRQEWYKIYTSAGVMLP